MTGDAGNVTSYITPGDGGLPTRVLARALFLLPFPLPLTFFLLVSWVELCSLGQLPRPFTSTLKQAFCIPRSPSVFPSFPSQAYGNAKPCASIRPHTKSQADSTTILEQLEQWATSSGTNGPAMSLSLLRFVRIPHSYSLRNASHVHYLDTIWAAFWGFLYRKFFWDFVGGTLRAPGGLQCVLVPRNHLCLTDGNVRH